MPRNKKSKFVRPRTISAVAFVMQQPRDYHKLAAIAETIDLPLKTFVVDDFHNKGYFTAACLELLSNHGVSRQTASQVLNSGRRFAIGIYQANTWRKYTEFTEEIYPIWLLRRLRLGRISWRAGGGSDQGTCGNFWFRFANSSRREGHVTNGKTANRIIKLGVTGHQGDRRSFVSSAIQRAMSFWGSLKQKMRVPVPLARKLSRVSVLAPPYHDDVSTYFPEIHIRDEFDFFLTATHRQSEAVRLVAGEKVETIGYPQYWSAQSIGQPSEELRNYLKLRSQQRIIAWLPLSSDADTEQQIDYLKPIAGAFSIVWRPHPDLHLPGRESRRRGLEEYAKANGILVQDSLATDAGLLVRGADLVIAEGVSTLLSSLFLGAPVVVGLNTPKPKFRKWDQEAGANLVSLVAVDQGVTPSSGLRELLDQPTWWADVERASDRVRKGFFGDIVSADDGRERSATALRRLTAKL